MICVLDCSYQKKTIRKDRNCAIALAKPARYILLGQLVLRSGEDFLRFIILYQISGPITIHIEEGRVIG